MNSKEWFVSWFDTTFYHLLYRERDDTEARKFIVNLLTHLKLPENSHVLDLACGKGRHSITLNELGMNVLGVDLSEQSISHAKQFENSKLHFRVQDMREPFDEEAFDCVFNLFTSFGYFEEEEENQKVLNGISNMTKEGGIFVLDYLNAITAVQNLVPHEEKEVDNVHFQINRTFDGKFIRKQIDVTSCDDKHKFEEKVRGFSQEEIDNMLKQAKLTPIEYFGDFKLNSFDANESTRLIVICKKDTRI
jgi:cyclopropane fatty-acyl-phospholipid synthase-like methyltransferase